MTTIKGDLTPSLGAPIVRIDAADDNIFQNDALASAIDALARQAALSRRQQAPTATRQPPHAAVGCDEPPASGCARLRYSDNALYIAWEYDPDRDVSELVGLVRVGRKRLFLHDRRRQPYEGRFVCVLDAFVAPAARRRGVATRLFAQMLAEERVTGGASRLAFDRPSVALLRYLAHRYGLVEPVWQNTNYVVFPTIFDAPDGQPADGAIPPEGWRRTTQPRHIDTVGGGGATAGGARFLDAAITGHSARQRASRDTSADATAGYGNRPADTAAAASMGETVAEEAAAHLQLEAHRRKQHVLSNRPLW